MKRSSILRRVRLAVLAIAVLVTIDAIYGVVRGGIALLDARSALSSAFVELRSGKTAKTGADFDRAAAHLADARSAFAHPGYLVLARLPFLGADARAAESLAAAAVPLADSGAELVALTAELKGPDGTIESGLMKDGRFQLGRLEQVAGIVGSVHRNVTDAQGTLDASPTPRLGTLREALASARHQVSDAEATLRKGVAIAGAAEELFGGLGRRRYLLAFQAPSEARGTGGLFGLFAILEAEDGALDIGSISRPPERLLAADAPQIIPVDAPGWFVSKYEQEGSLWNSSEVNLSPHFPTVAETLLRMYEKVEEVRLDGVLALDPNALAPLMEATGPIETPGLGVVDSSNARRTIMRDSYVDLTPDEQTLNLGLLLKEFFGRVRQGKVDGTAFLNGLGEAASRGNLKFYVRDSGSADALSVAQADGDFTDFGPMQQMVWHNSSSVSKIDWFLHRTIETVVRLQQDGSARVTTRILIENRAPDHPPSLLIGGLEEGYPAGSNRMRLDVLMPSRARLVSYSDGGTEIDPYRGDESGYPSAGADLVMGPESKRLISLAYVVEDAVDVASGERFAFTLYPHAAVRPDSYLLTIYGPDGFSLREPDSFVAGHDFLQIQGILERPTALKVELVPQ